MSSEISTETVRLKANPAEAQPKPEASTLEPWQFFVLAALGCATAALFATRGQGVTAIVLLTLLMGATALVGIAALRTLRPLVTAEEDRTAMFGHRTRVALEREKMLALRSIKELEFDRAMGKVSDSDWQEMSGRLRTRATRLMRQLDAGAGYREQIERDLAKRLGASAAAATTLASGVVRRADEPALANGQDWAAPPKATRTCGSCDTDNDTDAKFCKACGQKL
jgi:hypothetical protein